MKAFSDRRREYSILRLEGALRAPLTHEVVRRVQALLDRGDRRILLDLAGLASIDAAGIGELIRAFNATNAVGGVLRIAAANSRVRKLLRAAGVLRLLSAGSASAHHGSLAVGA